MNSVPEIEADQASRAGYKSRVFTVAPDAHPQRAGEVNPAWFKLAALLGIRPRFDSEGAVDGCWLNCEFHYAKPMGGYVVEAAAAFDHNARFTGQSYLRSCSCPDAHRRKADGAVGELRKCKHMITLGALISKSVLYPCPVMGLPAEAFPKGSKSVTEAQKLAIAWKSGQWEPASGWDEAA